VKQTVMRLGRRLVRRAGFDVVPYAPRVEDRYPHDFAPRALPVIDRVWPRYTMTTPERLHALCQAVEYVVRSEIPGAIVECGVWRGGSMMAVAQTLRDLGAGDRELYLCDTFTGMTEPTDLDVDVEGRLAAELLRGDGDRSATGVWAVSALDEVQRNMRSTGYHAGRLHYVVGPVEDTLPGQAPEQIALLRLDTDWYESTRHELEHLIPRLAPHGVLIVDDYGDWQGARRAVDEWLDTLPVPVLLNRIDHSGRIAVIPAAAVVAGV
jgi:O-methyltransferase